jgi:hypothetical protein
MKSSNRDSNRDRKSPRKRRRRNCLVLGFAIVFGICYIAENIGWSVSINKELSSSGSRSKLKRGYNSYSKQQHDSDIDIDIDSHSDDSNSIITETGVGGVDADVDVGGSAFCLLIKDDNSILSEWIAYHYHVFRMRRLIVAVDPESQTSPLEVLKHLGGNGNGNGNENGNLNNNYFDLNFTLWSDEDYTPAFFHQSSYSERDYSKLPNSVKKEVTLVDPSNLEGNADDINRLILKTKWHKNTTFVREHQDKVHRDVHGINNHRFRQKNFVSECFRQIKQEQQEQKPQRNDNGNGNTAISWAVHIDTDEFLVPNPWIASYVHNESDSDSSGSKHYFRRNDLMAMLPETPSAGSLWSLFHRFLAHNNSTAGCVMMPRILFGSREDGNKAATTTTAATSISSTKTNITTTTTKTTSWSHRKFESLRWKYHTDFKFNARPKSIVDDAQLGYKDDIFRTKLARSVHQPLFETLKSGRPGCSEEPLRIHNANQFS